MPRGFQFSKHRLAGMHRILLHWQTTQFPRRPPIETGHAPTTHLPTFYIASHRPVNHVIPVLPKIPSQHLGFVVILEWGVDLEFLFHRAIEARRELLVQQLLHPMHEQGVLIRWLFCLEHPEHYPVITGISGRRAVQQKEQVSQGELPGFPILIDGSQLYFANDKTLWIADALGCFEFSLDVSLSDVKVHRLHVVSPELFDSPHQMHQTIDPAAEQNCDHTHVLWLTIRQIFCLVVWNLRAKAT